MYELCICVHMCAYVCVYVYMYTTGQCLQEHVENT